MDAASTEPPPSPSAPSSRRRSRIKTKLPKAKVQQMAQAGLSTYQIAKVVDANQSTVHRFLKKIEPERQAVEAFKANRAEVLATLQAKNLTIQDKILDQLDDDGLLGALTPSQMSGIVFALNSQHGTLFDKERLERGQSSQNISVVSRMIDSAVQDIYKPLKDKGSVVPAPQQGAGSTESGDGSTTYSDAQQEQELGRDSEAGGPGGQGGNLSDVDGIDSQTASPVEKISS